MTDLPAYERRGKIAPGVGVAATGWLADAATMHAEPNTGNGYVTRVETTIGGAKLIEVRWLTGPLKERRTWHRQGSGEIVIRVQRERARS